MRKVRAQTFDWYFIYSGFWAQETFYFPLLQVAGRYRVMVESSMASADDIIFNCGDVIELLHEDSLGMW